MKPSFLDIGQTFSFSFLGWFYLENRTRVECAWRKETQVRMGLNGVINPRDGYSGDVRFLTLPLFGLLYADDLLAR